MTLFDILAGAVLAVSGLIGFARGATREVTTVIAFVLAAVIAVFSLRFTGAIAQHFIATPWMANAAAIRAYEKVGFRAVGVMRRSERDLDGSGWHDCVLMELLAGEEQAP